MRLFVGPATTPLTALLAHHLGAAAAHHGETPAPTTGSLVFLLPYRETPDAQDVAHLALRGIERWGDRPAILLSNAGVFDPRNPGVRRESDAPDAADTLGQTLAAAEAAFARRGPNRPIVRLPAPIARVPEAGVLLSLAADRAVPEGSFQGFDPASLATLLEPSLGVHLTHLACGPLPAQAVADALGTAVGVRTHLVDSGWDRLRTQWSEQWGRPDGLVSARRDTLPALLHLIRGTPI